MTRRESLAWGLVSVLFLACAAWTSTHLTFFWDDYNAILTQRESFIGSLFKGSGGHWTPLTGVFFFAEVHLFGYWYPGYVLTSGVLLCLSWWLLARVLVTWSVRHRWMWIVAGVLYVTCVGVLVNIFVATTVSFLLATALGAGAALAFVRGRTLIGSLLLLGSFLAMSGVFMVTAALAAAVVLVDSVLAPVSGDAQRRVSWRTPAILVVLGVVGTAVGHQLAVMNPTDYYAYLADPDATAAAPSGAVATAARTATFLLAAWVPAPLLPTVLSSTTAITTLSILLDKYALLVIAAIVVAAVVWAALVRRDAARGERRLPPSLLIAALLLPAALWAAEVAWARPDAVFTLRYALLWLLSVLAFWVTTLTRDPRTGFLRLFTRGGVALLSISAVAGVVLFPRALIASTNVDKPRWELSAEQDRQQRLCLSGVAMSSVEEIAPTFTDEQVCDVVTYVTDTSLTGALFGYPGGRSSEGAQG